MVGRTAFYFDITYKIQKCRDIIKGKTEEAVYEMLEQMGYKEGVDFVWQYAVEAKYVADFGFEQEKLLIEVDGKDHYEKEKWEADKERDRFYIECGWKILRIKHERFKKNPLFYKYLIKDLIDEQREGLVAN